jgi:hypothetical protein
MDLRSKQEYLDAIVVRYREVAREAKAATLNELCSSCGYHHKHTVRLPNIFLEPEKRQRGR